MASYGLPPSHNHKEYIIFIGQDRQGEARCRTERSGVELHITLTTRQGEARKGEERSGTLLHSQIILTGRGQERHGRELNGVARYGLERSGLENELRLVAERMLGVRFFSNSFSWSGKVSIGKSWLGEVRKAQNKEEKT